MTASRVLERLDELYAIGGGPGANRVGGSVGEDRAHEFAAAWMEEAGLTVEVDSAGNLVGRTSDPAVMTGSHLDSVPQGGKFDGALGVVAGIEAVERVGRGAVVVFRDEERGCVGSTAFAAAGPRPSVFLEVHVEQGPVLERAGAPLGLVTGIAGIVRADRVFEGSAGHAGTVPMSLRRDALVAAAEYVLHVRETAAAIDGVVATVGRLEVEPGFGNVIPGRVRVAVDARAPDRERLERLALALGAARGSARTHKQSAAFKVAWIYVGPHNDAGWSEAHDKGRLYVQKKLGSKVQTTYKQNIAVGPQLQQTVAALVRDGRVRGVEEDPVGRLRLERKALCTQVLAHRVGLQLGAVLPAPRQGGDERDVEVGLLLREHRGRLHDACPVRPEGVEEDEGCDREEAGGDRQGLLL